MGLRTYGFTSDVVVKFERFALRPQIDEPFEDERGAAQPVAGAGYAPDIVLKLRLR